MEPTAGPCKPIPLSADVVLWICPKGCTKHHGTPEEFIRNLVAYRRQTVSQKLIAKRMILSQSAVSKLENRRPRDWGLRQLTTYCCAVLHPKATTPGAAE